MTQSESDEFLDQFVRVHGGNDQSPGSACSESRRSFDECFQLIEPLLERGYNATLEVSKGLTYVDVISGGDSNCPCRKFYDPKDGHGYTLVEFDDFERTNSHESFTRNIMGQMLKFIEDHEGKQLPE